MYKHVKYVYKYTTQTTITLSPSKILSYNQSKNRYPQHHKQLNLESTDSYLKWSEEKLQRSTNMFYLIPTLSNLRLKKKYFPKNPLQNQIGEKKH